LLKRVFFFSMVCFWCLCQKSSGSSCVDSYLGLLFCYTSIHVCFCTTLVFFAISLQYSLKSGTVIPPDCLGYSCSFVLPNEI
jgi:hypothetical protein